jgi:hypothetical protein
MSYESCRGEDLLFVLCDDKDALRHQRKAAQAMTKKTLPVFAFAFESVLGGLSL